MVVTLLFIAGLILALLTLRDVVDTVVVPGRTGGVLKVLRRVILVSLPVWRRVRTREDGISTSFAPTALVAAFVIWMTLLTLGFGLMVHALAAAFSPPLQSFPQALFVAGSGLVTVGLSETDATGAARWVVMTSGFFGLAVVTLAVTYLLQVQGSIGRRDSAILKLTTSSGRPPSGLGLLERYVELDAASDLPQLLREARTWCAEVLQSHASHPSLIYFRSTGTSAGWPATLGAVMDLALIVEHFLDLPEWRGPAVLLKEEGGRMAEALIRVIGLDHSDQPPSRAEVEALLARLALLRLPMKAEQDVTAFITQRGRHAGCLRAMSNHLGSYDAPLAPAP